ncbi:MAG: glycosyltransferase [Ignavibacteria bacterium]|nr:glycosyltransferase [Ignavibacteria bacterium]
MKILFITSRIPYPLFRGDKLRVYNLIRNLSKSNEIILLSFVENKSEYELQNELAKYCTRIELIYLPVWKSVINSVLGFFSKLPIQVKYYNSKKMNTLVQNVIQEEKPDLIHTHLIRMAPYTFDIDHQKKVIDLTDAVSLYLKRFQKLTKNPFLKLFLLIEKNRMYKYEKIIQKYDRAFVCSEIDKEYLLSRNPKLKINLVYNGIELENYKTKKHIKRLNSIIFTGNMSYYPNSDAVEYFVKEIFPQILLKVPSAKFYIVGQNPSSKIIKMKSQNIIVTGFVKDICSEYLKSDIAVSPIRYGAGTLTKILESTSLGIPVIATPIGSLGLNLQHNKEILIANSKEEFADYVVKLLNSKKERERIGNNGKKKVRDLYGLGKITNDLNKIYSQL